MEVLNDGKFNLIETEDLIVKNMLNYPIHFDTHLDEFQSGALYLINNTNNNITINLPYRKNGLNFEFIFTNTNNNSIQFRTSTNPIDNSKIIGSDWLYLKRSNIEITYNSLNGSIIKFNKSEKGEHIKFYSDGTNYYIIHKNDTNNNINNIIQSFPSSLNQNYIINININSNNSYIYNIINENTSEPLKNIFMGSTYNFKFNTSSIEYNNITKLSSNILYKVYTYIDYYNTIDYNIEPIFDSNQNKFILNNFSTKYKYKYPVLNYYLTDHNNKYNTLNLLDTQYTLDIFNNSILYPTYLYTTIINNDINSENLLESNTSILNIFYNENTNNIIIYDENNTILYNHNNDRKFLIMNRDIKYTLNYYIINTQTDYLKLYTQETNNSAFKFYIDTLSTDISLITHVQQNYFKFTTSTIENNTFIIPISSLNSSTEQKNMYYLHLKYDEPILESNKKMFIIPMLFIDHLLLQTNSLSNISFSKQNKHITNSNITTSYEFNINSSVNIINNDFLELKLFNTDLNHKSIDSQNIYSLITQKLKIPISRDSIDNYLLKFMDNDKNTYNTTVTNSGIYKIFKLDTIYKNKQNININFYSELNNIIGGQFTLNPFTIDDSYSGKLLLLNLNTDISIHFKNTLQGNLFDIVIDNDNSIDKNTYTLTQKLNSNEYSEYYFIQNSDNTNLLKNITLYTSNTYYITIDRTTIKENDIIQNLSLLNDLLQFSDVSDGTHNLRKHLDYTFIKKYINTDNSISYIFTIPEYNFPAKLYYYNKNTKSMGGLINILSKNTLYKNVIFNSPYPFSIQTKYYINNISYEILNNSHILTLKQLIKGNSIKLYFHNNHFVLKEHNFTNNNNIIDYPDNIISTNLLDTQFILNNNKYDISFINKYNHIINYLSNSFKLIKNQIYYISQSHISNYNLNQNNTNNHFYLKLNNNNLFEFYNDSKFQNIVKNPILYRKNTYYFNQYHRSNYNPGFDIDLKRTFKITLQKNSNNIYTYHINNLESYSPNILKNTTYYFDLSDVYTYEFKLSLYNDGLNNNIITEYNNSSEITYKYITINNITYVNLIILKIMSDSTLSKLYYYSTNNRSIGGSINIINSTFNYNLDIQENKLYSDGLFYLKKYTPTYELKIKDQTNTNTINNLIIYKNILFPDLKYNFNFNSSIYNSSYNQNSIDSTIIIYVKLQYDPDIIIINPKLAYFDFYTDSSFNNKIPLPLTILKDKNYKFVQPNYMIDIFKFFIFINNTSSDYFNNFDTNNYFDTDIITKQTGSGITLNTNNLYTQHLYYSGIYYISSNLYSGQSISNLNNYDKILNNMKIFIISDKNIYLSDNIKNNTNIINNILITSPSSITNKNHIITQSNLIESNILNNDLSHFYLQNIIDSIQNINLSYSLDSNNKYIYLNKKNLNKNIFISSGSNYPYVLWNNQKHKSININTNIEYNLSLQNATSSDSYKLCYFSKDSNQLVDSSTNIINIKSNNSTITDYFIYNNTTNNTTFSNNNNTSLFTFSNIIPSSITNNFYNINIPITPLIYEYFITFQSSLSSFKLNITPFTNYTLHSVYKYTNYNTTNIPIDINNSITIENNLFYIDIHLIHNNTSFVYHLICFKEDSNFKSVVDFGKLYFNNLENNYEITNNLYKTLPIKFNLTENLNHNLPNSQLIQEYTIELLETEYYQEIDFAFETSKYFNINYDYYDNTKLTDTISQKNITSTNLYISDFKTIYLNNSHSSLLNHNITFYTDESATNKLTNNIIYSGKSGYNNSKIIININPTLHATLFYYTDCLYESKIQYNMLIKYDDIELITGTSSISDKKFKFKYKYKYNIIHYLDNIDIQYYFDNDNSLSYNSFNKCYFILYNNDNIYKGTIYSTIEDGLSVSIEHNIYLVFDELKFYDNNKINIDNTYTLKIFNHKPGQIITPNYLSFNKINNSSSISTTKLNLYHDSSDLYLINNKPITYLSESYLHYLSNSNEKYYITKNPNEPFTITNSINQNIPINNNIQLSNFTVKNYTTTVFKINNTVPTLSNSNKHYYTRLNNNLKFIDLNTVTKQNTTNQSSINSFYMYIDLYHTYFLSNIDYYSMDININGLNNMALILKPYQSYSFNIHKNFIYRLNNKSYTTSYQKNNIEKYFKLSIVNSDDTKELYSSYDCELNINLPHTSDSKLYIKVECKIKDISSNTFLNQHYYNRENTVFESSDTFIHYIPIFVDKKYVIQKKIKFTDDYYIQNHFNSLYIYNNFLYLFDVSDVNSTNKINFSITNKTTNSTELNTSYLQNTYTNQYLLYTNHNQNLTLTTNTNKLYLYYEQSEILNDNKNIILLNRDYNGNYSNSSDELKYNIKYIGSPGYNGQLIYNSNKTLDFNINMNNKAQNELYIHYNTYSKLNTILYKYVYDLYSTNNSFITLFEPIKLNIQYSIVNNQNQIIYNNIPITYSDNFFPGKPNSNVIMQIPKDLNNDEILYENLTFTGVGYYSNKEITNINNLTIIADIYTLQQQDATIFLNVKNNIIIRLPSPNYSYIYKFIVTDSNHDYNVTFISEYNIFINNNISPNIILNNNTLVFNKLIKGNSFTLTSNSSNYFLDNISIQSNYDTNSIIQFPSNITYKTFKVYPSVNKFELKDYKGVLYKDVKYSFNRLLLNNDYFKIYDIKSDSNLDLSNNILLNNYNNVYYIIEKNIITNTLFSSFTLNKYVINYKVSYNNITNTILFNNSSIPIIYNNYIYNFDYSGLTNFYILYNSDLSTIHTNNINTTNFMNINNNGSNINLVLNDTINIDSQSTSINNIFYNQILYYYYKSITLNSTNNILVINELDGLNTHTIILTISEIDYNTYYYSINTLNNPYTLNNNIINIFNTELKKTIRGSNFTFSIVDNCIKLTHNQNNFIVDKNNLYTTLNFSTNNISINKVLSADILYIRDTFKTDNYLNYYGDKLNIDYYTLSNEYTSNKITIDLIDDKHIKLPKIKENTQYTIIINNTIKNKSLFIHTINNINYNNNKGNILLIKPSDNDSLKTGSYISLISNNDNYIVFDYKNMPVFNLFNIHIYNHYSNFCNLYYTFNGLLNIDKYISVFGIHIIGLKSVNKNNNKLNESKFLYISKLFAKLVDFNQTKKPDDINIINTLNNYNSYIILYDDYPYDILNHKHSYSCAISYKDINMNYDFNQTISDYNVYDISIEKLIYFMTYAYIKTYPIQFDHNIITTNDLYKYIQYGKLSDSQIVIQDTRTIKNNINITNTFYNSIINSNNTNGNNLTIRINSLKTIYNILIHTITENDIEIINIGNGYKNNDIIKIELNTNLYILITLQISQNIYNIKHSHNEIYNKHLTTSVFNELINHNTYDIHNNQNGSIINDINNSRTNTSIPYNDILYNKQLNSHNDIQFYITTLLLGLLGFFTKRFSKNNIKTNLQYSILITPTLIEKYNKSFINLYLTSTLSNIKSLHNIDNYDLTNINYIKSNNSTLQNITLHISNKSIIDYNSLITTYNDIIFDNYLELLIHSESQFATINITSNILTTNNTNYIQNVVHKIDSNKFLIDTSTITSNDYNTKSLQINILTTAEDNTTTTSYNILANRLNNKSNNNNVNSIISKYEVNSKLINVDKKQNITNNTTILYNYNIDSMNLRNFIFDIDLENIYANATLSFSNLYSNTFIKNSFISNYSIKTSYDIVQANIIVTSENNTDQNYIIYFKRNPHNIQFLSNIQFSNVSYLQPFHKYNTFYSGLINVNNDFTISIDKVDIFSNLITTIEYYSTYYHSLHTVYNRSKNIIHIPSIKYVIDNTLLHNNPSIDTIKHIRINILSVSEDYTKKINYVYILHTYKPVTLNNNHVY